VDCTRKVGADTSSHFSSLVADYFSYRCGVQMDNDALLVLLLGDVWLEVPGCALRCVGMLSYQIFNIVVLLELCLG